MTEKSMCKPSDLLLSTVNGSALSFFEDGGFVETVINAVN
jgi:hypothetical protein